METNILSQLGIDISQLGRKFSAFIYEKVLAVSIMIGTKSPSQSVQEQSPPNSVQEQSLPKSEVQLFRNVVKDQIDSFRECAFAVVGSKDKFVCSQTKLKYNKMYSHVDHVYPLTFNSILFEFIKKYNVDLDSLEVSKDLGTSETQNILNEDVTKAFYEFHKERSVLRIVCSSANLQAKKTKDYNNEDPTKLRKTLLREYPQYHVKTEYTYETYKEE